MWSNPTLFHCTKSVKRNIEERQTLTQSIEKSFLIGPPTTNNAIYCDSLTLILLLKKKRSFRL